MNWIAATGLPRMFARLFDRKPVAIKQPSSRALPPGVISQSPDGFVQRLTPEEEEKMRQSIIHHRQRDAKIKADYMECMRLYPEQAGSLMSILSMYQGTAANYEATVALRWGVTVPYEPEPGKS